MRWNLCTWTKRRHPITRVVVATAIVCLLSLPAAAAAQEEPATWAARYGVAHKHLVLGEYRIAEQEFLGLTEGAPTETERRLAIEMARIAAKWAAGGDDSSSSAEPKLLPAKRPMRTRDEITLLYASSFMYGIGSGAWFLLQAQPDTALTATLPFIGITATPIIALAIIDGQSPLPHGVPHGIAVGMYVGLGEALLTVTYQHARARRVYGESADSKRLKPEDVSTVLWAGATVGGIVGATMTAGLPTTPGRASYTGSLALWGGALTGFTLGAIVPHTDYRTEHSLLGAGIGYNLGLVGGILTAARLSPSVARVRLVDLSGVAGGFAVGGTYLALARGGDPRIAMGTTAAGAAAGLAVGWLATRGMARDTAATGAPQLTVEPSIMPVAGGGVIGVAGAM